MKPVHFKEEPMKKLTLLILVLAIVITACAPPQPTLPTPGLTKPAATQPAKSSPTPAQTSDIPLSESLLLVRYNSRTNHHLLTAVDPANGYNLAKIEPISLGQEYYYALSPDRKTLAALVYQTANYPRGGDLRLISLEDWSVQKIDLGLKEWTSTIAYAPDGRHIAIAASQANGTLIMVDTAQGKVVLEGKAGLPIHRIKFSADSTSLMVYGVPQDPSNGVTDGDPAVGLLNASDFSWMWRSNLPGLRDGLYRKEGITGELHAPGNSFYFSPGHIFAPNADVLYIASAEKDELVTVDFAARSVQTRAIRPELSWFEQLLALTAGRARAKGMDGDEKSVIISPDGRFLYISGAHSEVITTKDDEPQFKRVSLGLQIVRTVDAVETGKFETESNDMSISPDGKLLYLRNWKSKFNSAFPVTDIFDTSQGKIIASMDNFALIPTQRLDGQPVLVSGYSTDDNSGTQLAAFKTGSTHPLHEWRASDYASWFIFP
jgi:hypothetical protein